MFKKMFKKYLYFIYISEIVIIRVVAVKKNMVRNFIVRPQINIVEIFLRLYLVVAHNSDKSSALRNHSANDTGKIT